MKKVVIYGSAQLGVQIAWHVKYENEIVCFVDSDPRKHSVNGGGVKIDGIEYPVYGPEKLRETDFDKIFIASEVPIYIEQITATLKSLGISENALDFSLTFIPYYARLNCIKTLSYAMQKSNIQGAVAELGVFRGDTAKRINEIFKDDDFYLLDTFEGFDIRDCEQEKYQGFSKANTSDFKQTSLKIVQSKMPYLEKCHFIQGYFPQSAMQIPEDVQFKFVNLDVDLYQPILAGLEYFYPRLAGGGGAMLVHDYFHPYYTGVKKAVDEYCSQNNIKPLPIGDAFSIMIIK
mgnify:CR=1 FL=1